MPSYTKVNYLLRLRKQIERRLIIESLQRLVPSKELAEYRYFGLGSIYYADYVLFHKHLNISRMTSVDNKAADRIRFEFNKPYGFIDFSLCDCGTYMRERLDWNEPLFMWLDYDLELAESMVLDVKFAASKAKPGDIIIITVEATPPTDLSIQAFATTFSAYIPRKWQLPDIAEDFTLALREILVECVRNGLANRTTQVAFVPFLSFSYRDTAPMYTLAGTFCAMGSESQVEGRLEGLSYVCFKPAVIDIQCPLLTPKEKACLDECICAGRFDDARNVTGINEDEASQYARYYKYYPLYFESAT